MLKVAVVAFLTGAIDDMNPFTRMSDIRLVSQLFSQCELHSMDILCIAPYDYISKQLLVALIVNFVLVVITYGIRVPGVHFHLKLGRFCTFHGYRGYNGKTVGDPPVTL